MAEIFSEEAPREGFELTWLPRRVSDEEKLPLMREADFLVLHPAQISGDLLRATYPASDEEKLPLMRETSWSSTRPRSLGTSCERPRSCA